MFFPVAMFGSSVFSAATRSAALGTANQPPAAQPAMALGVSDRKLAFPADFGAHPDTHIEWWYVTGALAVDGLADGPQFGFQLTFFRLRTSVAADHPSRFAASQIVFAHAALSVLADRRLRHDQRVSRAGFDIAQARTSDTDVWLRDWRLQRSGDTDASLYHARLDSTAAGFALDLQLKADRAPLLQGVDGLSRKGPDPAQASHYYSQPQLQTAGRLTLEGKVMSVRGTAWLDHEWSNSVLGADAVGWDWIGINLDDGGALTAFRIRRADGSAVYAGGSWQAPDRAVRNFAPTEVVFKPIRRWLSHRTQASYPVEWDLATPAGQFKLAAVFDDQELDSRRSTGSVYWEGLATLRDASGRHLGRGYLEMTGYAGPMQL
ncbi:MAG: carotenoid 1,2-hydratase [Ideonella sp.]